MAPTLVFIDGLPMHIPSICISPDNSGILVIQCLDCQCISGTYTHRLQHNIGCRYWLMPGNRLVDNEQIAAHNARILADMYNFGRYGYNSQRET